MLACSIALAVSGVALGAERTVDNVADLKTALAELTKSTDVITLQASPTPYEIDAPLAIVKATLRGSTDNPRDTVITANGACRVIDLSDCGAVVSLTVSNGYFEATGRSYTAAGVQGKYGTRGACIVSNCVVTCCRAEVASSGYGAGLAHCTVYCSQICGNSVLTKGSGGGLNDCAVYDSEIFGNTAAVNGGGATDSYFYRCRIFNNTASGKGGGVAQSTGGSTLKVLDHTVVSNNVARTEGGGCLAATEIRDSEIVFNKVEGTSAQSNTDISGGGLKDCAFVSNCVVRGNAVVGTAKSRSGGAASSSTLIDCPVVRDNYVESGYGAALYACTAVNCILTNNVTAAGSALRKVTATRCTFYGSPIDSSGSAAQISVFTGCRFLAHSNASDAYVLPAGANVAASGSFAGMSGFILLSTSSTTPASMELYATNCLFAGIDVPMSYFLNKGATMPVEFVNCTFSDNNCKESVRGTKDGVDVSANVKFVNTIFYRNYFNGTRVSFNTVGKSMTFDHCLFDLPKSVPDGNTLIDCVELPVNSDICYDTDNATDPYSLKRNSPAVGRGVVQDWMPAAKDLAGNPRLWGGAVDIGCYQYFRRRSGSAIVVR